MQTYRLFDKPTDAPGKSRGDFSVDHLPAGIRAEIEAHPKRNNWIAEDEAGNRVLAERNPLPKPIPAKPPEPPAASADGDEDESDEDSTVLSSSENSES